MKFRIVTRPDFDGVVCAALLKEALDSRAAIQWVQPNDIQNNRFSVKFGDVIANLPYDSRCALWFDHHISNSVIEPYHGLYRVAPSAAGLIYEYFQDKLKDQFDELVLQTDRIDSARLDQDEILFPERYPYVILSMATSFNPTSQITFCNRLVKLLRHQSIEQIMADNQVARRCRQVIKANSTYKIHLQAHTILQDGVSVTDFRYLDQTPEGNRFLVYSLFPQAFVNLKIHREGSWIGVKVGHSILNPACRVNMGRLMAIYDGGGHRGAGACRLNPKQAQEQIDAMIAILMRNQPDED